MIDLSNNNGTVDFHTVRAHHQEFVYLKRSEGDNFRDPDFEHYYRDARAAHMLVGAYHFARPSKNTPREEADFFARLLPRLRNGKDLRPCLDLEDPDYKHPDAKLGAWAEEWLALVKHATGHRPIIYGYGSYIEACQFKHPPTGLWLAAYGRNDGKEHPFRIPAPWNRARRRVLAHQYASTAKVPGVQGEVDISHVLHKAWLVCRRWQ